MSTTMRLKRFGTKKRPYYRVVVTIMAIVVF